MMRSQEKRVVHMMLPTELLYTGRVLSLVFFIYGVNIFVLFIFKLNDMYFVTFCDVLRNGILFNGL